VGARVRERNVWKNGILLDFGIEMAPGLLVAAGVFFSQCMASLFLFFTTCFFVGCGAIYTYMFHEFVDLDDDGVGGVRGAYRERRVECMGGLNRVRGGGWMSAWMDIWMAR
jgi:hypothetical protein